MIKKVGILLIVLIVPTFIYLGLKLNGTNHYKLPRFIPAIDSATGELQMKKVENPKWGEPEVDTVFQTIPNFELIDQDGKAFNSKVLSGKIFVASFFFTRCTTICPKISFQISRVRDAFLDHSDVKFISISVDPKFDSPQQLKKYANRFEAKASQWNFLTGEKSYIYPLVLKGFHVPLADASEYNEAIKNPDEAFIHSERLILVDKEGVIRGFYDGTDAKEVDRLILELNVLKSIYKNQ
jgi:protein SCO1/2